MTKLMQIQSFIQAYIMAISSILEVEVTVVDNRLIRVGGTDYYKKDIGTKISHDSYFKDIISTGKPGIIEDVKDAFECHKCDKRGICKELANLAYPIFLEKNVIGVIGIIAFKESERARLLRDRKKLEEFLKYMSLLLESKIFTLMRSRKLESQIQEVIREGHGERDRFIGQSPQIHSILRLIDKVSKTDSAVFITGESGTGKELIAKRIHEYSGRRDKLMISLNCGALPETLVESELFGYEEGAFTGAKKSGHIGKFELAHNSTLFLDEIGEMPLNIQIKLLRAVQEKSIQRIGGSSQIPVDVRIICATNRDIEKMVEEGKFRRDLFYRLNVIPVSLPPLRDRKDDIPLFISHFIAYYNKKFSKNIRGISPEAMQLLMNYKWPGNVRELKNIIEYLENIIDDDIIRVSALPNHFHISITGGDLKGTFSELMDEYERLVLSNFMANSPPDEDKAELARRLGLSRATLYRKLSAHGLINNL